MNISTDMKNDTLSLDIENPLHCPLTVIFRSASVEFAEQLDSVFPVIISQMSDTQVVFMTNVPKASLGLTMNAKLGHPNSAVKNQVFAFPFLKGKRYSIIQGYNGSFSHNSDYSRYAIDFDLSVGDTVCAAADGYVVGVIKDYEQGGNTREWRDYANYITLYHPESNLFTQYVHLKHQGSFVRVGDQVKEGQVIGISGDTGFTDGPHLHFNVLKAGDDGLISVPCTFLKVDGAELNEGVYLSH
ncbi:MAG: M23 family metallopeptidase [Saprospiraceae bacterium]|nr:M23 family metallopeptidase [Saprospiraceae bacterium]